MLSNFSILLSAQIDFFVSTLTTNNFDKHLLEIKQLIGKYGNDIYVYLIKCLFTNINFTSILNLSDNETSCRKLLKEELVFLVEKPYFVNILVTAIESIQILPKNLIHLISKALNLSKTQEIIIATSMIKSNNKEIQQQALNYLNREKNETIDDGFYFLPEGAIQTLYNIFKEFALIKYQRMIVEVLNSRFPEQIDLPLTFSPILEESVWFSNSNR
ncbi:hypothetical protein M0812_08837 [Anaeramoeba flamelloides]|uniref:Uncharacterized protein n=1 Tax=Anaeramoeba flamelloides TaxID=1746091 RepID=A0AAV7ZY97_9EUKA|nr:hypothetical protein M0812_08837 [Anaeramoeba flamelloides]